MLLAHPICIKYQDENNNILRVDTSELRFRGVRNSSSSWKLVLELSSLNHTYNFLISNVFCLRQSLSFIHGTKPGFRGDLPILV